MGRPLNDKFFVGDTSQDTDGKAGLQIRLTLASFTGGPSDVSNTWITRQRSPSRFEVTDGENIEVLKLFNGTGSIPAGTCALRVIPFGSSSEYLSALTSHQAKTFQGNVYTWTHLQSGNAASVTGEADFQPTME